MPYYHRKTTRIPNYDYSQANYYFLTVCTDRHICLFGDPGELNELGKIVQKHILFLHSHYEHVVVDKFVVMPNHFHMILVIKEREKVSADQIIGLLKAGISREIRKKNPALKIWQRSFHDHIIRNQRSYEKIWLYIENNPLKWEEDCFFVKNP